MIKFFIKSFHPCNFNLIIGAVGILTCPLLLDLVMDMLNGIPFELQSQQSKQSFIFRASLALVTLAYGFQVNSQGSFFDVFNNYAVSFWFGLWCMRLTIICSSMSYLHTINPKVFTLKETTLCSFIFAFTSVLRFYGASNTLLYMDMAYRFYPWVCLTILCKLLHTCVLLVMPNSKMLSLDDYKCLNVLGLIILAMIAAFGLPLYVALSTGYAFAILSDSSSLNVNIQLYVLAAAPIIMSIIPGRIARTEALASGKVLETKELYVRYISHELRTPLNTVLMGIEYSLDQISPASTNKLEIVARSALSETFEACDVAIEILNDLLLYDKMQSGLVILTKEKVKVWNFMETCVKTFKVQLRSKKLRLHMKSTGIAAGGGGGGDQLTALNIDDYVDVDKAKISQVIRNLLSNAIKFTPKNGDIRVDINVYPPRKAVQPEASTMLTTNGSIVIEVTDSGVGINKDDQERLFQEIVQFRPEVLQAGGGSGLGMFITKGIVDLHEGVISVNSDGEGKGTTFRVELPLSDCLSYASNIQHHILSLAQIFSNNTSTTFATAQSHLSVDFDFKIYDGYTHESAVSSSSSSSPVYTPQNLATDESPSRQQTLTLVSESGAAFVPNMYNFGRPLRLLLVDDAASSRKMMRRALESRNCFCDEAEDGQEAVSMMKAIIESSSNQANNDKYDAIFMDYMMPNMNGPTAAKEILRLGYRGIIIGLTGNALAKDKDLFMTAGCKQVLVKPVTASNVMEALSKELLAISTKHRRKSITDASN